MGHDQTYPKRALDRAGYRVSSVAVTEPAADAFGRLRVANPTTLFDSKMLFDKNPLFWDETITDNSGNATSTHDTSDASVSMYVEATDTIIRQTKQRFNYQPGKSQLVVCTGQLSNGGTGVMGRIGAFDANDGLFFELDDTTCSVVKRKATADTSVAQADWNLDKLDGTGPSGVTLDTTKAQIMFFDYEWLGVGRVRFGFYFDGLPVYVHEFDHVNELTSVYMSTPNLPVRYELSSAAGGASATMQHICSSVVSEGGSDLFGVIHAESTEGTAVVGTNADTIYAVIGLRLKGTHLDAIVKPEEVSMMAETADDFEWMLLLNPTVAGTPTFADVTNSACQSYTGASANVVTADSWDLRIAAGFTKNTNQGGSPVALDVQSAFGLGSTIAGTPDELVLAVRPLGAAAEIQGTLSWRELL